MRKYSWIFGLFIMSLCIGFGMIFPPVIFSKTLSRSLKQVEEYEIDPVDMGHSNTVIHAMRSCSDSEYALDYQEEMADLSREQLIEICNSFLEELKLEEWGYQNIVVKESSMKATCHLIVMNYDEAYRIKTIDATSYPVSLDESEIDTSSTDKEQNIVISSVIWRVEVEYSPNCFLVLKVDDKNQKVVQVINYAKDYSKEGKVSYQELTDAEPFVRKVILPFFQEYYDADVEIVEDDYWNCMIRITDKNKDAIILSLGISDGLLQMTTFE